MKKEEKDELLKIKQEEEEYLKEIEEFEELSRKQHENEELEFTCKVMQAIKTSIEILPDGKEYMVGNYDFSGVFHIVHGEFSGFFSDYVNIPKNKIVLQNDGTLVAEVLEDGSNFLISHNDPKYREWKQGKRQLWKAKYVFRIKLDKDIEDTYENIKEKLKF